MRASSLQTEKGKADRGFVLHWLHIATVVFSADHATASVCTYYGLKQQYPCRSSRAHNTAYMNA